jgi:hypothetical protein
VAISQIAEGGGAFGNERPGAATVPGGIRPALSAIHERVIAARRSAVGARLARDSQISLTIRLGQLFTINLS